MSSYIRFDWAMKRLLRNKANFAVLEGLLTTLLNDKITIQKLLESESNQEEEFDKYNRVDMLAEDSKGTLLLIEIQNNNEYAYFQRMLFGTSKLVTEYINRGEGYEKVRKVYSINIVLLHREIHSINCLPFYLFGQYLTRTLTFWTNSTRTILHSIDFVHSSIG